MWAVTQGIMRMSVYGFVFFTANYKITFIFTSTNCTSNSSLLKNAWSVRLKLLVFTFLQTFTVEITLIFHSVH